MDDKKLQWRSRGGKPEISCANYAARALGIRRHGFNDTIRKGLVIDPVELLFRAYEGATNFYEALFQLTTT